MQGRSSFPPPEWSRICDLGSPSCQQVMLTNPILVRVIDRESFREIITRLTPKQLVVAVLRADGLNDREIGWLLGLGRQTVSARMRKAAQDIGRDPELAPYVAGRTKCKWRVHPHDAIENPRVEGDLGTGEVAKLFEVSRRTVFDWIRDGRLPNAYQTPTGRWRVPAGDLKGLEPPGRGGRWGE